MSDSESNSNTNSVTYDDIEDEENEDSDIDIDYDWTTRSYKKKPEDEIKQNSDNDEDNSDNDEENDSDVDVSYDWNLNNINVNLNNNEDSYNMESPKFLDTPLYSNTPIVKDFSDYNIYTNMNLTTNEYNENEISQSGAESPISMLTPANSSEYTHQRFPSFKPSQSMNINIMKVIVEKNNENEHININIINENDTNYIQYIDNALGKYYKGFNILNYFNEFGKGKFMTFCIENKITNDNIYKYLHSELTDSSYLYFDKKFPFNVSNTIHDENIDEKTMEQLREVEVYTVIKYCFDNKKAPN